MAKIGVLKLNTQIGKVELPVYEIGDSGPNTFELWRVQTSSGAGFIPLTDYNSAKYSWLRIQTESQGTLAVNDQPSMMFEASRHYDFESGAGNILFDRVGENNGSISGPAWSTSSKNGSYALDWSSSGDKIGLPDYQSFSGDFSFITWIYPRSSGNSTSNAWLAALEDSNGNSFNLQLNDGGNKRINFYDNESDLKTSTSLSYGQWYMVAITYSYGGRSRIYINNTLDVDHSNSGSLGTSYGWGTDIGNRDDGSKTFDGLIDSTYIWDYELTQSEISDIYSRTS